MEPQGNSKSSEALHEGPQPCHPQVTRLLQWRQRSGSSASPLHVGCSEMWGLDRGQEFSVMPLGKHAHEEVLTHVFTVRACLVYTSACLCMYRSELVYKDAHRFLGSRSVECEDSSVAQTPTAWGLTYYRVCQRRLRRLGGYRIPRVAGFQTAFHMCQAELAPFP